MQYRKAIFDNKQPKLPEAEMGKFAQALANLDSVAAVIYDGRVCTQRDIEYVNGVAYFNGWSWPIYDAISCMQGRHRAEPDFVAFTLDMVNRLGLLEKNK